MDHNRYKPMNLPSQLPDRLPCDLDNAVQGLISLGDTESLELAKRILEHIPMVYKRLGGVLTKSGEQRYRRLMDQVVRRNKS